MKPRLPRRTQRNAEKVKGELTGIFRIIRIKGFMNS